MDTGGVVLIGLGRFGLSLAEELIRDGVEVLGIDKDPDLVQSVANRLTHVVQANATDEEAMTQLGVAEFERVVIGVGNDLEASILSASVVIGLGVENVWAKAISAAHARILTQIGVQHVVRPEHDMGKRVAHLIRGGLMDYIELDDGYAFAKTFPTDELVGVPLGQTDLRRQRKVTVVGVKHGDGAFTYATNETVIAKDDVIIVSGARDDVERFGRAR